MTASPALSICLWSSPVQDIASRSSIGGREMQSTNEPGAEFAALRAVTLDYLDGMVNANEQHLRRAFHPRCLLVGHYHGILECETVDQFIAAVLNGAPAAAD